MFDSDLVWQMQLIIIQGKNLCCVLVLSREFLTLNDY